MTRINYPFLPNNFALVSVEPVNEYRIFLGGQELEITFLTIHFFLVIVERDSVFLGESANFGSLMSLNVIDRTFICEFQNFRLPKSRAEYMNGLQMQYFDLK